MATSQKCVSPKNLHDSNCKTKLDDIIKMAISQKCVKQKSFQDTAILVLHYPQLQFARVGAAAQDGHQPRVHLEPVMGVQRTSWQDLARPGKLADTPMTGST